MILLTPPSPSRTKFFKQSVNEATDRPYSTISSKPSTFHVDVLPSFQGNPPSQEMTTPHRGLEHGLPPGMILPDPLRGPQPHSSGHGSGPQKTAHGYEQEDNTRALQLQLKAEEDKRRQEEERRRQEEQRTRQEELRLEQRRVEQEMLRESIGRGIHPNLVPLIFVGLGAGNVAGAGFEMAQQYIAQFQQVGLQVQNTLQQNSSPDVRRDSHMTRPTQYGVIQQPLQQGIHQGSATMSGPHSTSQSQQAANVYPSPAYQSPHSQSRALLSGSSRFAAPATASKPPVESSLPRLTTNEAQVQQAPQGAASSYNHSQPQAQNSTPNQTQERASPSPSIYFHHWQPPATQTSTPSGKESQKTSPKNPANHPNSSDPSPRKRKAQGAHQAAPPPTSAPSHTSPTFSTTSSTSSRHVGRRRSSANSKIGYEPSEEIARKRNRSYSHDSRDLAKSPPSDQPASLELQSSKDSDSKPST